MPNVLSMVRSRRRMLPLSSTMRTLSDLSSLPKAVLRSPTLRSTFQSFTGIGITEQVSSGLIADSSRRPPYIVAGNACHSYTLRLWLDESCLSFLGFAFPEGERQEKQRPLKQGKQTRKRKSFGIKVLNRCSRVTWRNELLRPVTGRMPSTSHRGRAFTSGNPGVR